MLRRATEDDAERIARLHVASWRTTYGRELPADFLDRQDVGARSSLWQGYLRQGVAVVLAEDGAELIGFVACGPVREGESGCGVWQIYTLHVSPPRQRQGIGGTLFTSAVGLAREQGAAELVLWVVDSNSGARSFYESRGMECDGERRERPVGEDHQLHTVRYRMRLSVGAP
jgi:ribosomal protein S18 acetylase RimI-like enzyme